MKPEKQPIHGALLTVPKDADGNVLTFRSHEDFEAWRAMCELPAVSFTEFCEDEGIDPSDPDALVGYQELLNSIHRLGWGRKGEGR